MFQTGARNERDEGFRPPVSTEPEHKRAVDNPPPWSLWLPLFIGGVYVGGQLVVGAFGLAFWLLTLPPNQEPEAAGFAAWPLFPWVVLGAAAIAALVALALTWIFLRLRVEHPLAALGFVRGPRWLLILTPPFTFLTMMGITAWATVLLGTNDISVETQEMLFETPMLGMASAFVVSLLAPPIEEILFRSLLFEPVRYRLGRGWAVVISAALFAGAHLSMVSAGEAIIGLLAIWFLLGIFLGALRLFSGTLWAPLLAHITWNVIASAASLLAQSLIH